MNKRLGYGHELGIAAVHIAARGPKLFAQVLFASATKVACSACGEDPGNADPLTGSEGTRPRARVHDPPDDLVAEHDGQLRRRHPTFDLVQLRVAHPA